MKGGRGVKGVIISLSVALVLFCGLYFYKETVKTDEEQIKDRIDSFLTAYNTGDGKGVLDCLDAKTRNKFEAAINITESIVGTFTKGCDISIYDLFAVGTGVLTDGELLSVEIQQITLTDEENATVDITMTYKDNLSEITDDAVFVMVKENDGWYVRDFKEA